jgi:hypothetical protein
MDAETRKLVRQRADGRCEYCRLPESADEWPFHVDHIVAKAHTVNDDPANLAWACTQCNLHKGTNFASIDPESSARVDLFDPRNQNWLDHFRIGKDARIIGLTPMGRATVRLLSMNVGPRVELRRELIEQGAYS